MRVKPAFIDPFDDADSAGRPTCRLARWTGGAETGLSEDDVARVARLVSEDRRQHLRGSLILRREIVAEVAGCPASAVRLSADKDGAPVLLEPAGWSVSLSTKEEVTAIAMQPARAYIGVDVEKVRPADWRAMMRMISSEAEHDRLKAALGELEHPLPAFYRLWTLKEAVLKAKGQGFRAGPKNVALSVEQIRAPGQGSLEAFGADYDFWSAEQEDLVLSLVRRRD